MKESTKGYLKLAGYGAGFGITSNLLSGLSNALTKQSLGFNPPSLKNLVKVGLLSGGTAAGLVAIDNQWGIFSKMGV